MYRLKTSATFDSAHFLAGYDGKCANIHGHCWRIEAEFSGEELEPVGQERGMLMDFSVIKKAVRSLHSEKETCVHGFLFPAHPPISCFQARAVKLLSVILWRNW